MLASTNEAVGDGRFIKPSLKTLKDAYSDEELFQINTEEVKQVEEWLYKAAAGCAQVAAHYESANCMRTSIHALSVDTTDIFSKFWYDKEYMVT